MRSITSGARCCRSRANPGLTRNFSAPSRPSFSGQVCAGQIGAGDRAPFRLEPRQHTAAAARDDRSREPRGSLAGRAQPGPALALAERERLPSWSRAPYLASVHARNPIECVRCLRTTPIAAALLAWYDRHRRDLPWRAAPGQRPDPYRVWLSEIMLQQTTVATVGPYFDQFVARFPDIRALAAASLDEVLHAWQGLGYYARARNLHACAQVVVAAHGGAFPDDPARLRALPGIGDYTAAAIAAIAFDRPVAAVDGNVERVVARLFAERTPLPRGKPRLRALAAALVPERRAGDFAQAMMDLGAVLCTPRGRAACCARGAPIAPPPLPGIAEDLPVQAEKPERPLRYGVAFWLTRRGRGRIAAPPSGTGAARRHDRAALDRLARGAVGRRRGRRRRAGRSGLARAARNRAPRLHPFPARTRRCSPGRRADPIAGIWARPAEFKNHAFPTLTRKLASHALSALQVRSDQPASRRRVSSSGMLSIG